MATLTVVALLSWFAAGFLAECLCVGSLQRIMRAFPGWVEGRLADRYARREHWVMIALGWIGLIAMVSVLICDKKLQDIRLALPPKKFWPWKPP